MRHKIDTGNSPQIKQRPRRLPFAHRHEVDQQVKDMLAEDVIEPSMSAWSSPIVLVRKQDGQFRLCIDYRKLNSVTDYVVHSITIVDDILDSLNSAKLFTLLKAQWLLASSYRPRGQVQDSICHTRWFVSIHKDALWIKFSPVFVSAYN